MKPPPVDASRAIELAYGLLWLAPTDTATLAGRCAELARRALRDRIDLEARRRGLKAAQDLLAAEYGPPQSERIPEQ